MLAALNYQHANLHKDLMTPLLPNFRIFFGLYIKFVL